MKPAQPHAVTPVQWLAVLAIWGLVAYGAFGSQPAAREPARLIACR